MASSLSKSEKAVWEFGILSVIGLVTMLIGTSAAQWLQSLLVENGLTQNKGLFPALASLFLALGCWLFGYYFYKNIRRASSLYGKIGLVMTIALFVGAFLGTGASAATSMIILFTSGYWLGYTIHGPTPR